MSRRIESLELDGPAGRLEALWAVPQHPRAAAALVCHPHPQHGGTMHSKAVHATAKALGDAGLPVLRFNFRGVGRSSGRYTGGPGERDDARAALAWLQRTMPGAPLLVGGFSFGAWVALAVGEGVPGIAGLLALAPPLGMYDFTFVAAAGPPILCLAGERDAFCPPEARHRFAAGHADRVRLEVVPGAEHLLSAHLPSLAAAVARFTAACLGPAPGS